MHILPYELQKKRDGCGDEEMTANIYVSTQQLPKTFPMDHLPHLKFTTIAPIYALAHFANKESGSGRLHTLSKVTHLIKTGSKPRTQLFTVYFNIVPTTLEQGHVHGTEPSWRPKHQLHSLVYNLVNFYTAVLNNSLIRFLHGFLWLEQYTLRMVLLNGQLSSRIAFPRSKLNKETSQ